MGFLTTIAPAEQYIYRKEFTNYESCNCMYTENSVSLHWCFQKSKTY